MSFYAGRRALVTGGNGFLGSYVVEQLLEQGAQVRVACRSEAPSLPPDVEVVRGDLRRPDFAREATQGVDTVFHLAAFGFGLGANSERLPELLTQNLLINTNVLDAAHASGVERYLFTSSSSVYSGELTVLDDEVPWAGVPHGTEATFGWAKRVGELQAAAYVEHYGMGIAIVRPTNPYGPRDTFDAQKSHVLPALILRAEAKEDPFVVWGSGRAERSFVHARDVARGMLLALERQADGDPVNLAATETTSVGDLARLVLEATGHDAEIVFDTTKPEGAPKKVASVAKARDRIGFEATIALAEGVQETVDWYRREHVQR